MTFKDNLVNIFKIYNIDLTKNQIEMFEKYYTLLISWNDMFNLTTITEQNDVIVKHFLDSCLALNFIRQNAQIIDIGCGAGFPTIPLKILRPDINLTLVDSVNKKINFINEVISSLNLKNTTAIHSRAEDLAKKSDFRENFDLCLSRAVAKLNVLCEYCLPFVKVGGELFAYKAQDVVSEIEEAKNALQILGGKIKSVKNFNIEGNERTLIFVEKIKFSPKNYPRDKNKPRTNPL